MMTMNSTAYGGRRIFMTLHSGYEAWFKRLALVCPALSAGIGVVALAGWTMKWPIIARIEPDSIPMAPSTAVLIILLGGSLSVHRLYPQRLISRIGSGVCVVVALLCLFILFSFFSGKMPEIEHSVFGQAGSMGRVPTGHMSPITASSILVCSLASLLLLFPSAESKELFRHAAAYPAAFVVLTGAVIMIGYLFGTPILYGGAVIPVALPTSLVLVMLATGLLAASGGDSWPVRLFIGPSVHARLMRSFIPVAIVVILFAGWLDTAVMFPLMRNHALTSSLVAIMSLFIFGFIVTRMAQTIGSSIDSSIAERKRAGEAVRLAAAYSRRLIEASLDPLVTIGPDGKITDVNAATESVTGYSRKDLIGADFSNFFTEPDKARAGYERVFREGVVRDYSLEIRRRDGYLTPVLYNAAVYRDEAGVVIGVFAAARDVTAQREAEAEIKNAYADMERKVRDRTLELSEANERLKELDRLKSMFIASMSHELRTPLNSIIGFSSIMLEEWIGPLNVEQKDNLATIHRSGKHLLNLINDVIDVSKIEAGIVDMHIEDFDIYDLIIESAATLGKEIGDKGLELKVEPIHQLMHTDRRRLLQAVLNLLSNAVKFTEKGSITLQTFIHERVSTAAKSPFADISVADTGIGIQAADIPRLFNAFVRLDSPLRSRIGGTGLGLYLTRKLVTDVLKGEILCFSRYDEGSRFTISVPVNINEKSTGN